MNTGTIVKNEPKTPENSLAKKITWDNIRSPFNAQVVRAKAEEELNTINPNSTGVKADSYIYKAFTLQEFENGVLLSESFMEEYKVFVLELSKQIQEEYHCNTPSQKATAQLVAHAYGRVLQAQMVVTRYLVKREFTDLGIRYMAVFSKELDRANRHYLAALQTLQMLKQPHMNITVKTQTANIANQQLIQENNNVNPK